MSDELSTKMESEFDQFAGWTADAVDGRPMDEAIAAACRGSGNPSALAWLADRLDVGPSTRFVDAGGGLGGPAAWLRQLHGPTVVVVEPMGRAARGARSLWDLPVVRGWGERLPIASGRFDAGWALGVIDTTTAKLDVLRELRRVTRPGGQFGLLSYEQAETTKPLGRAPDGNDFPTGPETLQLLADAGWGVAAIVDASTLDDAPPWWDDAADEVEEAVMTEHDGEEGVDDVRSQQSVLGRLLRSGQITTRLYHLQRS